MISNIEEFNLKLYTCMKKKFDISHFKDHVLDLMFIKLEEMGKK